MIKKAVGLVLSLTIVIGVLSAFGVMYFMSLQDGIMNGIFIYTNEALEEDDESEAPNTKKEDNNYTGEILLIVLLVATASSIIFAITLASDIRNKKITKEKLNAAIEVMIQKKM